MLEEEWSKSLYKVIGYRITKKRLENKLTQQQLSDKAGLSRTSITLIELGKQKLPIDRVYRIAEVLKTEPRFFFPDVEDVFGIKKEAESFFTKEEETQIAGILRSYKLYKTALKDLLEQCE